MPTVQTTHDGAEFGAAIDAFDPRKFGFDVTDSGWIRRIKDRQIEFVPLFWQHAHSPSYDLIGGQRVPTDALNLLVKLQQRTWGMPPEGLVPANILAIIPDTGASVLVAFDAKVGFNADGWLGFVFGLGARSGTLVSHMLGVREDARGSGAIGWFLKIIQAHEALKSGHSGMIWTYDPMRGANARLNLEKLGAPVRELTIDKYGALVSELYGDVPSDRFTAYWNLLASSTAKRVRQVFEGEYRSPVPSDIEDVPEVSIENVAELLALSPKQIKYRIPGDIDELARTEPERAVRWRQEMRQALPRLVTTKRPETATVDPKRTVAVPVASDYGQYIINAFATGTGEAFERESFYILERIVDAWESGT